MHPALLRYSSVEYTRYPPSSRLAESGASAPRIAPLISLQALIVLSGMWLSALGAAGCAQVDLQTVLEVTEFSSGYYDAGVTDVGANKLVPSVTFQLKNISPDPVTSVDLVVFFWGTEYEEPKELDEVIVTVIGSDGLATGATSDPIVVRSKQGFALEQQARAELFNHRLFRDVTAKLFLKRGGKLVAFGEYTIDRRVLLAPPMESTSR
jgi:hypothetical protein